ncbi:MAG: hypothetical protein INR62_08745 [Rhodospirillales bacterium]|nr:hypothetical protein [Acetobacter sp.]
MQVISDTDSSTARTARLQILLNYCRTVVRSDEDSLRLAMGQYRQALAAEQGS